MEGGDYVNEDAIGRPYVWQCIENQPESEGADPTKAECVVLRWEREQIDNVYTRSLRIQKWDVNYASYKFSETVAANFNSPVKYFEALVTGGKATYKGESEASAKEGEDLAFVTTNSPYQGGEKMSLTKSSVGEKSSSLVMDKNLNGTDQLTQRMIETFESTLPGLSYKGTFGGWYNMRVPDSEDKVQFYTVEDVAFKASDSSDSAFAVSATMGVAAVYAALAF